MIEDLKNQSNTIVAYHYCDFMDVSSTSSETILRSLFVQLLVHLQIDWLSDFTDLAARKVRRESPPAELPDLSELVQKASSSHRRHKSRVIIAVDGLDECNTHRAGLLSCLRDLALLHGISVFVTSRKEYDIEKAFQNLSSISLNDQKHQIEMDMKTYVDNELHNRPELARLQDSLKKEMRGILVTRADGM